MRRTSGARRAAGRRGPNPHPGAGENSVVSCGCQVLVEDDRAAKRPVRQQRVLRHRADALPAASLVEPLRFGARRVEHQQCLASIEGCLLGGREHQRAHTMATRTASHQHLGNVGPMRLVFLRRPYGLRGAQGRAALILGDDQRAFATFEARRDTTPIDLCLGPRHRPHEIHRRTAFHAVDEHIAESCQLARSDGVEFAEHRHAHGVARSSAMRLASRSRAPAAYALHAFESRKAVDFGLRSRLATFASRSNASGCGVSRMPHSSPAMESMDFSKLVTRIASALNLKPGAETELRLSAYTMLWQLSPSHDFQVQEVPPGVCPGVKCAVIAMPPTRSVSPSAMTRTLATAGKLLCAGPKSNCGSSPVGPPLSSARFAAGLAATGAWLARCRAAIPPA